MPSPTRTTMGTSLGMQRGSSSTHQPQRDAGMFCSAMRGNRPALEGYTMEFGNVIWFMGQRQLFREKGRRKDPWSLL